MKPVLLLLVLVALATGSALADVPAEALRLAAAGQPAAALNAVDEALKGKPRDAELRFIRGVLLVDLGDREAARQTFTALSQEYPELPDPLNNLAVLQAAEGDLDSARVLLERALRNNPRHKAARENLGDVFLQLAIRQWQSIADEARPEPLLARKLLLARELAAITTGKLP